MSKRSFQAFAAIMACLALLAALIGAGSAAASNSKQASISKKHKAKRGPRGKRGATGAIGATGATGAKGATGATGATGAPGEAVAYALVHPDGTVDPEHSKNVTSANVSHPQTGVYCFHDLSFTPLSVVASPNEGALPIPAIAAGTSEVVGGFCDSTNQAGAFIWSQASALENYQFTIWFEK